MEIFRDFLCGYVREMICEVMAAEVTEFCGLKHSPSTSDITIGRAKVTIQRRYVSLLKKDTATYHIFVRAKRAVKQASREKQRRWVVERMHRTRILNSSSDHTGADKGELKEWQPNKPKLS